MMQGTRLYIVTDNPRLAAVYFFARYLEFVPGWAKVVSTIEDIGRIPNGARAVGVWFTPFGPLNECWIRRRCEVKIVGDHFEVLAAIREWRSRPFQSEPEVSPATDASPAHDTEPSPAPATPAPTPPLEMLETTVPEPRWK